VQSYPCSPTILSVPSRSFGFAVPCRICGARDGCERGARSQGCRLVSAVPSVVRQSNQTLPIFTVYREERADSFPDSLAGEEKLQVP
jgi:hypothetical protein